jgi:TRAP-type transport system periplasmic protein
MWEAMTMINILKAWTGLAARSIVLIVTILIVMASDAMAQSNNPIVMKLSTATLNDTQHEWMKRFAVAIEKNSNGRIKAEVYPASQLGSIPRQIEGTQLGSIQAWIGPPEFLVGVDQRFELLSVPGLFQNDNQALKTLADPELSRAFLSLGANKGLVGATLFPSGPSSFVTRTPFRSLPDLKGKKIRVLASPFQTEQLARLGATGVALSLGDVLPALQQGTLDGAMSALPVFTALQYYDSAKFINETAHSYVFTIVVFSKKWVDALPSELQPVVMSTSQQLRDEILSWYAEFLVQQRKVWVNKGGELESLSAGDHAELIQKMSSIGPDIVKTKPDLTPLWETLVAAAKRSE